MGWDEREHGTPRVEFKLVRTPELVRCISQMLHRAFVNHHRNFKSLSSHNYETTTRSVYRSIVDEYVDTNKDKHFRPSYIIIRPAQYDVSLWVKLSASA
jgi:hypothetical protein